MNIKDAKTQIENAVRAYLATDDQGMPLIPAAAQRPVFLLGAPGIGKTAVMAQVAAELGIGLVAYSMTHHTRQSALGLPFIVRKDYGGQSYDVSEYTMSEIIAAVYDYQEATGLSRGILFLDEVNCVSETLTPALLQFLQFKTFGRHRVPDGWIVACAGNPPEYNKSVREFDLVTWDRLKRIDVEPDYAVWKEYARSAGVHPSVLTYLELKPEDFYQVSSTVDGRRFVTARGWEDLSRMIRAYEREGMAVDELLVGQYVQDRAIAKRFAISYDLFRKYRETYRVEDVLDGVADEPLVATAREASFDERLSLIGMVSDGLETAMRSALAVEACVEHLHGQLGEEKEELSRAEGNEVRAALDRLAACERESLEAGRAGGSVPLERYRMQLAAIAFWEALGGACDRSEGQATWQAVATAFEAEVDALSQANERAQRRLEHAFSFVEHTFGAESQEMLLLVTALSTSANGVRFIDTRGCEPYARASKALLFHERATDLEEKVRDLGF